MKIEDIHKEKGKWKKVDPSEIAAEENSSEKKASKKKWEKKNFEGTKEGDGEGKVKNKDDEWESKDDTDDSKPNEDLGGGNGKKIKCPTSSEEQGWKSRVDWNCEEEEGRKLFSSPQCQFDVGDDRID